LSSESSIIGNFSGEIMFDIFNIFEGGS